LAAAVDLGGVYTSKDSGKTWVLNNLPSLAWYSIASSADGNKLVAVAGGSTTTGPVYTSTDSGNTWISNSMPARRWVSVASSGDGTKLVAGTYTDYAYISRNSGNTWSSKGAPSAYWSAITSSADGNKLAAVVMNTGNLSRLIYTWQLIPRLTLSLSTNIFALPGRKFSTNKVAVINWPTNDLVFSLQQSSSLTTTNWLAVTNSTTFTNGQNRIILLLTNGSRFYRLKNP
jgi:hypothetical protein